MRVKDGLYLRRSAYDVVPGFCRIAFTWELARCIFAFTSGRLRVDQIVHINEITCTETLVLCTRTLLAWVRVRFSHRDEPVGGSLFVEHRQNVRKRNVQRRRIVVGVDAEPVVRAQLFVEHDLNVCF